MPVEGETDARSQLRPLENLGLRGRHQDKDGPPALMNERQDLPQLRPEVAVDALGLIHQYDRVAETMEVDRRPGLGIEDRVPELNHRRDDHRGPPIPKEPLRAFPFTRLVIFSFFVFIIKSREH